jgi:hypothetical protein
VVNIYVRIVCGLMLSLSSLAMATAEGAVVRFESDTKLFKSLDISQRQKSLPFGPRKGRSKSAEKNIPTDFWPGREAHSFFGGNGFVLGDKPQLPDWFASDSFFDRLESLEYEDLQALLRELSQGKSDWHNDLTGDQWRQLKDWLPDGNVVIGRPSSTPKAGASSVPIPAGVWLMLSGLGFLVSRAVTRKN